MHDIARRVWYLSALVEELRAILEKEQQKHHYVITVKNNKKIYGTKQVWDQKSLYKNYTESTLFIYIIV